MMHLFSAQSFSPSAGKESKVWEKIQDVQKGTSWHWTKPHLVYEARFIQPTCLGLPVEISKYYSIVNAITMKGELYSAICCQFPIRRLLVMVKLGLNAKENKI